MEKYLQNSKKAVLLLLAGFLLWGCSQSLQRGMLGTTYISTARPAISIAVPNMPLMLSGEGTANMFWTGVLGGLPIDLWLAVYGTGGLAPMAIVAQAQVPQNWIWDSDMIKPFSVDHGNEAFGGTDYQACTFIVNPQKDPFGALVTGVQADGQPQLWLVRAFQARYNFNQDKIILQYREPLPQGITSLTALPLGQDKLLQEFAQRARQAFAVGALPAENIKTQSGYAEGIQWQYMEQNFLGTVSRLDLFLRD